MCWGQSAPLGVQAPLCEEPHLLEEGDAEEETWTFEEERFSAVLWGYKDVMFQVSSQGLSTCNIRATESSYDCMFVSSSQQP